MHVIHFCLNFFSKKSDILKLLPLFPFFLLDLVPFLICQSGFFAKKEVVDLANTYAYKNDQTYDPADKLKHKRAFQNYIPIFDKTGA